MWEEIKENYSEFVSSAKDEAEEDDDEGEAIARLAAVQDRFKLENDPIREDILMHFDEEDYYNRFQEDQFDRWKPGVDNAYWNSFSEDIVDEEFEAADSAWKISHWYFFIYWIIVFFVI
jgi:hypothetical protein